VSGHSQIEVRVGEIETVARDIKRFRLEPASGTTLPLFSAGSHVRVTMTDGAKSFCNPYSLMGSPTEGASYQISVLKTAMSRGGSHFMHDTLKLDSRLKISHPVNLFPVDQRGRKHILIAGGIGITPFISMAEQLSCAGRPFELHYVIRDRGRGAYASDLTAKYGPRVRIYCRSDDEQLPLSRLLDNQPLGTHLYVCGPASMIEGVLASARAEGWPNENLHTEHFLAPPVGEPFKVRLEKSSLSVNVGERQSILEAVEAAGVDAPYLCRGGACGQCETNVLSADGEIVHNDHYLTSEDRRLGKKIMICISRFKGNGLVVDL
jgi:ferredoxin-NADP reductase